MRDTKKKADGSEQIRVLYPKFKNGEASIRDIRIEQNFGKKHQPLSSVNHTCRSIDLEFFVHDLFYPVSSAHPLPLGTFFVTSISVFLKINMNTILLYSHFQTRENRFCFLFVIVFIFITFFFNVKIMLRSFTRLTWRLKIPNSLVLLQMSHGTKHRY